MKLILGGAYQGKQEYVQNNSDKPLTVFNCSDISVDVDFSKDVINSFHKLVLAHVKNQIDTTNYIKDNMAQFGNKTIIIDDISCGVVPVDKELRQWREAAGRAASLLSENADTVVRVFCGIGMRIK